MLRTLLICLFGLSLAPMAHAQQWSFSRQSFEKSTTMGYPPPEGAIKLEDPYGETYVYELDGRLYLTGSAPGSYAKWATFELGGFEDWWVLDPPRRDKLVDLEVIEEGKTRRIVLDLKRLHDSSTLKYVIE